MGAGLIIAIGAQNAFVLKQGLRREHRAVIAAFCSFSDALLIVLGIAGMGFVFTSHPLVTKAFAFAGCLYLLWFAFTCFRSAYRGGSLNAADGSKGISVKKTVMTLAALTYLNPHVYLDTVVMLGSFGAVRPCAERIFFGLGAVSASFVWFYSLAFLSRFLEPVFRSTRAWRILDCAIGCVMLYIAAKMVLFGLSA
jgi:L-lysine exporter family protein LysE/ArgO